MGIIGLEGETVGIDVAAHQSKGGYGSSPQGAGQYKRYRTFCDASNAKSAEKLMTAQRAAAQEQYSRTMADKCAAYKPQGLISRLIRNDMIEKIGDQTSKTILGR